MAAVLLMIGKHLEQPELVQRMLDVQLTPCKPQYNYAPEVRLQAVSPIPTCMQDDARSHHRLPRACKSWHMLVILFAA